MSDRKKIAVKHTEDLSSHLNVSLSELISVLQSFADKSGMDAEKARVIIDANYGYYDSLELEFELKWTEERMETDEEMKKRLKRNEKVRKARSKNV